MGKEDHWKALAEAGDALQLAVGEWKERATPQTLAGANAAVHEYEPDEKGGA